MYRAIRVYGGGQRKELNHFHLLEQAYEWLLPSLDQQKEERWHIKVLPSVRQDFEKDGFQYTLVGENECISSTNECSLYIQIVSNDTYDDPLPRF